MSAARCIIYVLLSTLAASAQVSRTAELEALRQKEGGVHGDDEVSPIEKGMSWLNDKKVMERLTRGASGFRVVFGNLITGAGFAVGPEYYRDEIKDGAVQFKTSFRASTRKAMLAEAQLSLPKLLNRRAYLDLATRWQNYPGVNYYGQGPDSRKEGRSAFRLENATYDFSFGAQPLRGLRLGVTGGYLQVNVGPADDNRFVSAERIYFPDTTPGIDNQTDFLRGGLLAQYDTRDFPGGAKSGGFYQARFDYYQDRDLKRHSHRQLRLEAQRFIPFFNKRRVIAVRAKTVLGFENGNQSIPFYLQPVLGGSEDMRGFRFFRFYDDNQFVVNTEYRWEIFTGLDAALFYDAGKVFPRKSQLNFHDLEGSAGFGFRVNARNTVFMRIDVGFSHEGYQVWFKFNDVF